MCPAWATREIDSLGRDSVDVKRTTRTWIVVLLALLGLAGCTWTDTVSLPADQDSYQVYGTQTVGQVFTCHHAGLKGISVWLRATADESMVTLRLKESPDDTQDIASTTVAISPTDAPAFVRFDLPLQDDVNGKSFFLLIESPELDEAQAVLAPYQVGSNRTLVLDGTPTDGHLSFQLHYDNFYIVKDLVRQAVTLGGKTLWLLFLSALLYLLPGGAVVVWLLREGDWIERTILATGLSVAILALLMYATMTGLRLNSAIVIGFLALCGSAIAVRWWLDGRQGTFKAPSWRDVVSSLRQDPSPAVLAFVFALVLGVRLWVVRDLVAPMWGDSYQHTMISQLMIENGGLFDSWEPYAPLTTFTYHFGFHANVAIYRWLSGDDMLHSVIWTGQILNALAVLVLYPLAVKVSGGNRWAGVGAVLVAGLLSPMPMYYVNWGRYTQLAGQVILPVAMWLTWRLTDKVKWDWKWVTLLAISLAGLGITHYRVILMYGVFVIAWGIFFVWRKWKRWREMGQVVLGLAAAAAITLVLFAPWGMRTFEAKIPEAAQYLVKQGNQSEFHSGEYNAIGPITSFLPQGLLLLCIGTLVWLTWHRQWTGWVFAFWVGLLLILSNPYILYLPGTGILNNFSVFIMLYIPSGILIGTAIDRLTIWMLKKWRWANMLLVIGVIGTVGWGNYQRAKDIDPGYILVTTADLEAMAWIRENTSPDAKFLVNGFLAYGETLVVGADAGWWIPLLTNRQNTIPPLTYTMEVSGIACYAEQLLVTLSSLKKISLVQSEGISFLDDLGITHIYIGHGKGMIGNQGDSLLAIDTFLSNPIYHLVYTNNQVWIFLVTSEVDSS